MSDYKKFGLSDDPFQVFESWQKEALSKEENANAFSFASVDEQGRADVRYLLYKGIREGGLSFFSHTDSRKGYQLEHNCSGAIAFYWHQTGRQVRVRGTVSLLPLEVSREYFAGRDQQSKLASAVSKQSSEIDSRAEFEARLQNFAEDCDGIIEAPDHWRGYTLVPDEWEFFIYGAHRVNDRFLYRPNEKEGWTIVRLQP